jgi:hypothetical protein
MDHGGCNWQAFKKPARNFSHAPAEESVQIKRISNNSEQIRLRMKICQIKTQIARNSWLLRRFATQSWRILASRQLLMSC